jgi:uncharacterized protein (DUF427 family)
MAKATVNGVVLAESDDYEVVEGNIYFPPDDVNMDYFAETDHHTTCPWKGEASYYTIDVDGTTLENAAWFYPQPKEAASQIKDHVAFYTSKVNVEK